MSTTETEPLRELGLFAGAGGGLLASRLLGWRTVCAVELETYCQRVLAQRQRDGHLEPFPIWDDVRTFDGRPWRGRIDVVSGGFPCQDISCAGRGAGLAGDRSGLWFEMLRIIGEVQPRFVFAENSPMLRTRGLGVVLQGLAGLGYSVAWGVLGADDVGAPHRRKRMWLVAALPNANGRRQRSLTEHAEMASAPRTSGDASDTDSVELRQQPGRGCRARRKGAPQPRDDRAERWATTYSGSAGAPLTGPCGLRAQHAVTGGSDGADDRQWWRVYRFAGVDDGLADRVGAIKATGNGQVPAVAELAWRILSPLAIEASRG